MSFPPLSSTLTSPLRHLLEATQELLNAIAVYPPDEKDDPLDVYDELNILAGQLGVIRKRFLDLSPTCQECGRPLYRFESQVAGIGPYCQAHAGQRKYDQGVAAGTIPLHVYDEASQSYVTVPHPSAKPRRILHTDL